MTKILCLLWQHLALFASIMRVHSVYFISLGCSEYKTAGRKLGVLWRNKLCGLSLIKAIVLIMAVRQWLTAVQKKNLQKPKYFYSFFGLFIFKEERIKEVLFKIG